MSALIVWQVSMSPRLSSTEKPGIGPSHGWLEAGDERDGGSWRRQVSVRSSELAKNQQRWLLSSSAAPDQSLVRPGYSVNNSHPRSRSWAVLDEPLAPQDIQNVFFRSQSVTSSSTGLAALRATAQVGSKRNLRSTTHLSTCSPPDAKTMPPKPATKDANDAQKQRQTNLEIDLLKSAWIQKDRESPPNTGKNQERPRSEMNGGPLRETKDKQAQLRLACRQTGRQRQRALILSVALRHATVVSSIHQQNP
ncbi:hypothetical protein GN958_ATG01365 [Phytophthora infestans]|uniref:Uncharacterized protein n=1 Tax=Phytophthora infestans TaxID=4787 RepID=A0A8S9V9U4_PHYIN|nr:hypothetical protein GN958_ATG01365 [Phytophthora infestans]